MSEPLNDAEKQTLLQIAREAIEYSLKAKPLPPLDKALLTPRLLEDGASFVTLTIHSGLRGCIGALEAYQPLVQDVREHAIAAAFEDPRFPPLSENEFGRVKIEISRLTAAHELDYSTSDDLLQKLHPHVDGVILKHGPRRATFLPQVWEKIPDPAEFLDQLCYKMGSRPGLWRETKVQVLIYQVEEFHE